MSARNNRGRLSDGFNNYIVVSVVAMEFWTLAQFQVTTTQHMGEWSMQLVHFSPPCFIYAPTYFV